MAPFISSALQRFGQLSRRGAARDFETATERPKDAQAAYLRRLLAANADTEFGRSHGFAQIRGPEDYAERVPLQQPLQLQPWVRRMMEGETNLLSAERPIYYATTSGTTSEPKHIPITPTYRQELQSTVHVSLAHLYRKFPEAFRSKALYFVGSRRTGKAKDGCDIGHMSGFNFTELPRVIRALYAWPYELFEVKDHAARNTLALLLATAGRPSMIAGVYPAPIVYLLRELEEHAGKLAKVLRDGALPKDLDLSVEQRAFFSSKLKGPNREAARRLTRAAEAPAHEKVAKAWPELRLAYCWMSSSAGLFVPELKRRLGPGVAVRDAIYSACEGWSSIPLGDEEPGGVLGINVHFFEFIEASAYERGERTAVGLERVELGGRYYIVLTTGSGLYRYVLGDVVEVYGNYHKAPRIRFLMKGGVHANVLGEKMDEAHVNAAMTEASRSVGQEATFFTLAPTSRAGGLGYVLYLELSHGLAPDLPRRVAEACDRGLQHVNREYGELRLGGRLRPLEVVPLAPGTYDLIRHRRMAEGSAESQLKTAHLYASRDALPEEIKAAGTI